MKIELKTGEGGNWGCVVTREPGDKKYYGAVNAAGESALLYAVKNILNSQGHHFIKTRMWKHGHLVDDIQQYLYDKVSGVAIWNNFFSLRGADEDFNEGKVVLCVDNLKKGK